MSEALPGAGQAPPGDGLEPLGSPGVNCAAEGTGAAVAPRDPTTDTSELPPGSLAAEEAETSGTTTGSARRARRWALSWLTVIVVGAAVALLLRLFVVQTFFVPSPSMLPTLQVGDRMLVLKLGYSVDRGAIVVFRRPAGDLVDPQNDDLVKRVIGLPGEYIWSVGNSVYINGKPLAQPWLPRGEALGPPIARQKIPPNDYFMMGDNRANSYDSRSWGPLPRSHIVGRVFLVIWRHGGPAFHVL